MCAMPTNLVAEIVVTLTCVTNWTGFVADKQELGYVATNHVATITYEDTPHVFALKTTQSGIAVWRPESARNSLILKWPSGTNIYWDSRTMVVTNDAVFR